MRKGWVIALTIILILLLPACGAEIDSKESASLTPEPIRLSEEDYVELVIGIFDDLLDSLSVMTHNADTLNLEWDEGLYQEFKVEKDHVSFLAMKFSEVSPPSRYEEAHGYLAAAVESSLEIARFLDGYVKGEDISVLEIKAEIREFASNAKKGIEEIL